MNKSVANDFQHFLPPPPEKDQIHTNRNGLQYEISKQVVRPGPPAPKGTILKSHLFNPESCRALEAPGLEINIFIKRIDKNKIGFGHGAQIGKSSSIALEASRLEINTFVKRIYKEKISFR